MPPTSRCAGQAVCLACSHAWSHAGQAGRAPGPSGRPRPLGCVERGAGRELSWPLFAIAFQVAQAGLPAGSALSLLSPLPCHLASCSLPACLAFLSIHCSFALRMLPSSVFWLSGAFCDSLGVFMSLCPSYSLLPLLFSLYGVSLFRFSWRPKFWLCNCASRLCYSMLDKRFDNVYLFWPMGKHVKKMALTRANISYMAAALGRCARGVPKNITEEERERRRKHGIGQIPLLAKYREEWRAKRKAMKEAQAAAAPVEPAVPAEASIDSLSPVI